MVPAQQVTGQHDTLFHFCTLAAVGKHRQMTYTAVGPAQDSLVMNRRPRPIYGRRTLATVSAGAECWQWEPALDRRRWAPSPDGQRLELALGS